MRAFKAIFFDSITLHLINDDNFEQVKELFSGFPDSSEMHHELEHSYQPKPETERRSRYGFYAVLNDQLAGLSLLEVDNWERAAALLEGHVVEPGIISPTGGVEVADLVAKLVHGGVRVSVVEPQRRNLEQIYLAMTQQNSSAN